MQPLKKYIKTENLVIWQDIPEILIEKIRLQTNMHSMVALKMHTHSHTQTTS